jgi:hypothetical protein
MFGGLGQAYGLASIALKNSTLFHNPQHGIYIAYIPFARVNTMHKLNNRFNYLRGMEALAAVLLPIIFILDWRKSAEGVHWPLGLSALLAVSYLLLQGSLYWQLKHGALSESAPLPAYFERLFNAFKVSNLVLFGAVALGFTAQIVHAGWSVQLAWPLGIFLFAVLEHINYYHYQLMYDTSASVRYVMRNRRLRKAALGVDLNRCAGRSA